MGEVPRAVGEDPCKPVLYESPSGRLGSWTVGQRPMDSCAACAVAVFMYCAELGEGGYTLRCEGGTLFSVPWSHATRAVVFCAFAEQGEQGNVTVDIARILHVLGRLVANEHLEGRMEGTITCDVINVVALTG